MTLMCYFWTCNETKHGGRGCVMQIKFIQRTNEKANEINNDSKILYTKCKGLNLFFRNTL